VYGATVSRDPISRITDKVTWGDDRVAQPAAGPGHGDELGQRLALLFGHRSSEGNTT
jgi:hypothetical protein